MKNFYLREKLINKSVMIVLLLIFLWPNLSFSQTPVPVWSSSFESPQIPNIPGYVYRPSSTEWTFIGDAGLTKSGPSNAFTGSNPPPPSGNQVLFLQNLAYVERNHDFVSDGYYRFRFKAAWRVNCCGKTKYIRIIVNDGNGAVEVGEIEIKSGTYEEYVTPPVYMTGVPHLVQIHGDQPSIPEDYTGFVDDFVIEKIDELPYPSNSNSNVTIPSTAIYAIGSAPYDLGILKIDGTLLAPQNQDVSIMAASILVRNSGRFQIGQELAPYTRDATITLDGKVTDTKQHGHMGTKFLGAMGNGVIELHGKEKVSWTKLRETVNPGSSDIKLAESVDWELGDEIVIAPSRAPSRTPAGVEDDSFADEYEKRTITAMSNLNKDLTLNADLANRHTGVAKPYSGNGQNWTVDMRAEVGLLTRNIKIQGDEHPDINDPLKDMYHFGAHVMLMRTDDDILYNRKPKAYFNGVELYRMGQNKKLGRYPFHWHKMDDVDGQYFKNSSVHLSYNRALTIHRTNNTLVENNVFFDHIGHGIFFEEGNEEGNKILGNLVIGSKRPLPAEAISSHDKDGETINDWQNRGPAAYWITHPNNTIEGNVAAGTVGTGFWYIFPRWDTGGQSKEPQKAPFGSFKNNVAHSASSGFDIFDELGWTEWNNNVSQFYPHSVHANIGYLSTSVYEILNSTWYANRIGVYTGTGDNRYHLDEYGRGIYAPNDHLIFKNNIFADNEKAVMLASDNQIKNSIFVDDTGEGNAPSSGRSLAFVYDGAAKISDSHIVGYNIPNSGSSMISFAGAAFTYGNFRFKDVTKDPSNSNLIFNASGQTSGKGRRNVTIYDEDGSLTGYAGSTLVVDDDLDFNLLGNPYVEFPMPGWTDMKRSSNTYVNTRLRVHIDDHQYYGWMPDVNVVRTKPGTQTRTVPKTQDTPTLPFITNDPDLLYSYEWVYGAQDIHSIMNFGNRLLQFKLARTAEPGDFVIVRFKDMGDLPGVFVDMNSEERVHASQTALTIPEKVNLSGLKYSSTSAYYINSYTKDLYIKAVSNGDFAQYFNIKWSAPLGGVANNSVSLGGEQSLTETTGMIYPNPASDKLYIKGLAKGEEVQIVDLGGRVVQTTTYKEYLDISQLKSGVYVVRTKNGSHRFIKE